MAARLSARHASVAGTSRHQPAVRTYPPRLYAALGLPVNVRGLSLGDIKAVRQEESSGRIAISGRIRNVTQARAPVPRMTFDLRDARGAVLASWSENPPKPSLAAKETLAFTTEAPSLPIGGTDIIIRFTDAQPKQALLAAFTSKARFSQPARKAFTTRKSFVCPTRRTLR